MKALASLVSGGYSIEESFTLLDSRVTDAWSRIKVDDVDFTSGIRFGKDHEDIEGYTHKATRSKKV